MCEEKDLCKQFLRHWQQDYPDIISGWNTNFFDIPYIINRFRMLFGEEYAKKLSLGIIYGKEKLF